MAENRYDSSDIVRRVFLMNAEGLKFASYLVRDMIAKSGGIDQFSSLQHHLTYVPVTSMGRMLGRDHETVMVNEIGATVYAVLADEQVGFLAEVIEKVEEIGDAFTVKRFYGPQDSALQIDAFRRPTDNVVEFAITQGPSLLGILSIESARMFIMLAKRARTGPPVDQSGPDMSKAEGIAGAVDRAMREPGEPIDVADLDA